MRAKVTTQTRVNRRVFGFGLTQAGTPFLSLAPSFSWVLTIRNNAKTVLTVFQIGSRAEYCP